MKQELSALTDLRLDQGSSCRLTENVSVCLTGIGRSNAQKGAKKLIDEGANVLISWGTAAALGKELQAGTLCLPTTVITSSGKELPANRELQKKLIERLPAKITISTYALAETSGILSSVKTKKALQKSTGAQSSDMESGAIITIAEENNIPFLAVRAISDTHQMAIPASVTNATINGEINIPAFIRRLLLQPNDWLSVIKLAFSYRKAQRTLKDTGKILAFFP